MMLGRKDGGLVLGLALMAQTTVMLPVFLLGSLSPLIMIDVGLDEFGIGLAVAIFFAASAAGSALLAPLADRADAWQVSRKSLLVVSGAGLLIALFGQHVWVIFACLFVSGMTNGLIHPATNVVIARQVASNRQGLAFGIKQSSIPLATMLGGFAVPLIGITFGWKWAFAIAAFAALFAMILCPRSGAKPVESPDGPSARLPRNTLLLLGLMSGLGAGSANAMAAFLVPSIVANGHPVGSAGIVLGVGSVVSILIRLASGYAADRNLIPLLPSVALMFLAGGIGYGFLAATSNMPLIVVGALLGFGLGWGWSALSILATVRANLGAAGSATGITQAGLFSGAVLGPLCFGWLVTLYSYAVAWAAMGMIAVGAAICAWAAQRHLAHYHSQRASL